MSDWHRRSCGVCGYPELDVHLHGGVSCPACGWEGEWSPEGGLWPDAPEEAAARAPDTFPAEWRAARRIVRLAGVYHWSADIHEPAEAKRRELYQREDIQGLAATPEGEEVEAR